MKKIVRKSVAVVLAVFLAGPGLAWSGEIASVDAGFLTSGAAGADAGLRSAAVPSQLNIDFNAAVPGAGLEDGLASQVAESVAPMAEDRQAPAASSGEDEPSQESQALHQQYEEAAQRNVKEFEEEVSQFKAGVFGLKLLAQKSGHQVLYVIAVTVDGALTPSSVVEEKFASGAIPETEKANWEATRATIKTLGKKLAGILRANEEAHQAVHQQMEVIERAQAMRKIKERLTIGKELESWGVPNKISVDQGGPAGLRYSNLYRMNGMPTELGMAFHKVLAPMVARDPAVLSRITQGQIHDAIRLLAEGRKYVLDPSSEDFQKLRRMGVISEGYAYPEWREAFLKKAKEALSAAPEAEDKPFGLGLRPANQLPSEVLKGIFKDTVERYQSRAKADAPQEELSGLQRLILSLSGATGLPINMGAGPMMVGVQHRQLLPILAELEKRQADDEVVKAVIRSFPLGESLYRLGVHKLWDRGLTGQGIKVAVIDNGVDFEHPDFSEVKSHSENLTRDRGWFTKGAHGTPMADIIHAIAPDAEIQSYQALSNAPLPGVRLSGEETNAAILAAMDRAKANGAQVISLSLGAPMGLANDAMAKKIAKFAKEGILVVVSAGNSGFDLPGNFQLATPGTAPDAITVGAADYHGNKAYFSASGLSMDPEDHSLQDKPDIYAFGVNIKAAARLPKEVYGQEAVPYADVSGTSPAAPHVSGLAALMVQAAQEGGLQTRQERTVPAAKEALRTAARMVAHLPVLESAERAVDAFIRALSLRPGA